MNIFCQDYFFTLDDLIPGGNNYDTYRVKMPEQIQWWGDQLIYIEKDSVYLYSPFNSSEFLFSKAILNNLLSAEADKPEKPGKITFPYKDKTVSIIHTKNKFYFYDFKKNEITYAIGIPEKAQNIDFNITNSLLAYTKENNLYILSDGEEIPVTNEQNKDIVSGQAVHRNEFGIEKGTFWSPKGNFLAFYYMDESMVTDYPLVNINSRVAELKNIKYPMAGMKSHEVKLGIYDIKNRKIIYLDTGLPKDKYLTNIAWSPDEKYIYIAEVSRGQDSCHLNCYNISTGKLEITLFEETHPKYVEPQHPVVFMKSKPDLFLWQSRRDGYTHIYLYNTKGQLVKQLTKGEWEVTSILGFDKKEENLYYISTEVSPLERHIYKINLKNGSKIKLSDGEGVHKGILSNTGEYMADIYSSQFNPGTVIVTKTKTNSKKTFFEAQNPYKDRILPEITIGFLKADDGISNLYYRLVKPVDFNPEKRYPAIVYVYGGPHSQMIVNSWMGQVRGWDIYMAQKGYVVFTLDNRGTSYRGAEFENVIHRQLGITETRDQLTGAEYLTSLPFVDASRIGVHGWSYGGFMTLNLILRHPDIFKVGVAGGPVTDWKYYEVMYGERYMDTPEENPEGYKEASMLEKAGNLKGRLLLIHGDEDPTVVMQHSLQYLNSSIKSGTHPDFFVYPGQGHNMTGKDRIHLHEKITRYFEDFLK